MLDEARPAVVTTVTLTGRQLPAALETAAIALLADLWAAGLRHGVRPKDWRAVASMSTACLDVLTLVAARRRNNP